MTPSMQAELARVFLADACSGEALRPHYPGCELPNFSPVDEQEALSVASAWHRPTYLHRRAATPLEVSELLALRGLPELGRYLSLIVWDGMRRQGAAARWCRDTACNIERGTVGTHKAFTEKPPADVAAALRWAASRFDTFAPLPEIEYQEPAAADSEPPIMPRRRNRSSAFRDTKR